MTTPTEPPPAEPPQPAQPRIWLSSRRLYQEFRSQFKSSMPVDKLDGGGGSEGEEEEDDDKKPSQNRGQNFRDYLKFQRPMLWKILWILLLATVAVAMEMVIPWCTGRVVDRVLQNTDMAAHEKARLISLSCLGLLTLAFLSSVINSVRDWMTQRANAVGMSRLKRRLYGHLLRLPLARIHRIKTGRIVSRLTGDVDSIKGFLQMAFISPLMSIEKLLIALGIVFSVNWRLALVLLATMVPVALLSMVWVKPLRRLWQIFYKRKGTVDARLTETFSGLRVVRSFHQEKSEARRQQAGNHSLIRIELQGALLSATTHVPWAFLIPAAGVAILWYGGYMTLDGRATIGDIFMFIGYTQSILWPVYNLVQTFSELQRSLAAVDRVFEILREPTEVASDPPDAIDAPAVVKDVSFEFVDFNYSADKQIIHNFSLHIPHGATVALVGPSGAGKSTLTDLVSRFYTPTCGRILLNGTDTLHYRLSSYRRLFAMVQQEVFLFDGSIADNIAFGDKGATRAQIIEAARSANAHNFIIELSQGYDTMIGERGAKLSGGQRQRLSIARAILANPQILILDEATSALDSESEKLIQEALDRFQKNRTTFVIAHRLSTIAKADIIVVLEKGRLVESGSHAELMAKGGRYLEMVSKQRDAFNVE